MRVWLCASVAPHRLAVLVERLWAAVEWLLTGSMRSRVLFAHRVGRGVEKGEVAGPCGRLWN